MFARAGIAAMRVARRRRWGWQPVPGSALHIAVEATPNPKSMKFLPQNRLVIEADEGGDVGTCWSFRAAVHDVDSVREGAPLAADILDLEYVDEVMLTPTSITVNVTRVSHWTDVKPAILEIVEEAYDAQLYNPFSIIENAELAKAVGTSGSEVAWAPGSLESEIEDVLDSHIRPFVQDDGGDIYLVGVAPEDGFGAADSVVAKVQLIGACSGCPSSAVTLHGRVETMLKHYFPEIASVVQVEDEAILRAHDAHPKPTLEEHIRNLTQEGENSSVVWEKDSEVLSPTVSHRSGRRHYSTISTPQRRGLSTAPNGARTSILFPSPLWRANLILSNQSHSGKGRGGSAGVLDERINLKVQKKVMEVFHGVRSKNTDRGVAVRRYTAAGFDERMAPNNEFFQYQVNNICATPFDDENISSVPNNLLWLDEFSDSTEMKNVANVFRKSCLWFLQESFGVDPKQARQFVHGKQLAVWASVHGPGSGHPYHVHADSVLSGVYYASMPPGSGSIQFCDPRGVSPYLPLHQDEAMPPFHNVHSVRPIVGDLMVFPSWLPHAVEPCSESANKDRPRISISFNLLGRWDELPECRLQLRSEKSGMRNKVSGTVERDKTFDRFVDRAVPTSTDHLMATEQDYEIVDEVQDFQALVANFSKKTKTGRTMQEQENLSNKWQK